METKTIDIESSSKKYESSFKTA